jgi:hypothetical protein
MAELRFECRGAVAEPYAAAPTLRFRLRISDSTGAGVHALALRCQLRIEPHHRSYQPAESDRLTYLFGEPARWGETLKPLQLATVSVVLPGFTGSTEADLPVPCSYDLEVAAGKYLHALTDGEVPLLLLFSGTVFVKAGSGFQVEQVPWHAEAQYRLPVSVWRELMDRYFPHSGWLRLHRETIDALLRYKSEHAIPTWDAALTRLVAQAEGVQQ